MVYFFLQNATQPAPAMMQTWPTVLPSHVPKEQPAKSRDMNNVSLTGVQQTLDQLVKMMAAQQADQLQVKNEIKQLRTDFSRLESVIAAKPAWLPQLESNLALNFDRQLKKLEETNSSAKTQQV